MCEKREQGRKEKIRGKERKERDKDSEGKTEAVWD